MTRSDDFTKIILKKKTKKKNSAILGEFPQKIIVLFQLSKANKTIMTFDKMTVECPV